MHMDKESKQYFGALNEKLDRVIMAMATHEDIARLGARVDAMERKFDDRFNKVMTAIDGLTKIVTDLATEYAMIKLQLDRYDRWFKQIAAHTGVKLEI